MWLYLPDVNFSVVWERRSLEKSQGSSCCQATFPWWEPWKDAELARRLRQQYPACFLYVIRPILLILMLRKPEPLFSPVRVEEFQIRAGGVLWWPALYVSRDTRRTAAKPPCISPGGLLNHHRSNCHFSWLLFILLTRVLPFQVEGRCWILLDFVLTYIHVHTLFGYKDTGDLSSLTICSWGMLAKGRLCPPLQRPLYKT